MQRYVDVELDFKYKRTLRRNGIKITQKNLDHRFFDFIKNKSHSKLDNKPIF